MNKGLVQNGPCLQKFIFQLNRRFMTKSCPSENLNARDWWPKKFRASSWILTFLTLGACFGKNELFEENVKISDFVIYSSKWWYYTPKWKYLGRCSKFLRSSILGVQIFWRATLGHEPSIQQKNKLL